MTLLPEVLQEYHASVAEHEILLSFNADEDAIAFYDWWNTRGSNQWLAWMKKQGNKED